LLLRLAAVTILLATAAALGAGRLNLPRTGLTAVLTAPTPIPVVSASPAVTPAAALSSQQETAMEIGVGGETAIGDGDPSADVPPLTAAQEAATATPEAAAAAAVASPPPAPTETPAPTATSAPTEVPAAAASPAVEAATPAPSVATPDQVAAQAAAFAADAQAAQELVLGPLRLSIESAVRGASLPRYALPPSTGDWVVLRLELRDDGDAPTSLAMSDLRLFDRGSGTVMNLDSGTDVIAKLAGLDPAWSAEDAIALDPGETSEALAVFLLPAGASEDLALIVGQASIDVAPSLALENATLASVPDLIQATVTDVIDGDRIAVTIDGAPETVQYIGLTAPEAGACFATEATAANAQLVDGQTVFLERESSDRGDDGALLRDVWITDASGQRALVAARLLEAGAGVAAPTAPDTRYQSWLAASAALGLTNGAGMWAACPPPVAAA
jgi:endonuclease YncB( thermonuclease family)